MLKLILTLLWRRLMCLIGIHYSLPEGDMGGDLKYSRCKDYVTIRGFMRGVMSREEVGRLFTPTTSRRWWG